MAPADNVPATREGARMQRSDARRRLVAARWFAWLLLVACAPAQAIAIFDDRSAWLAAIGGAPTFTEDFAGFTADTSFGGAPLGLGPFTLSVTSAIGDVGQFIDVPPFAAAASVEFDTNRLIAFVDGDGVTVDMLFAPGVTAWGADYSGAATGEGLTFVIANDFVHEVFDIGSDDGFFGFVLGALEGAIGRLRLQATTADGRLASGEAFALDNIAGVQAPVVISEPGAGALLAIALAAAPSTVRRRRLRG